MRPSIMLKTMLLVVAVFGMAAAAVPVSAKDAAFRRYAIGNLSAPTPGPVSGGLLLLGGGDRNGDSMRWFFGKAGHGHIVVLRASQGPEIGEEFFNQIGGIASVETFVFFRRSAATDRAILDSLKKADGIFIAGGDQARYVRFWKGTAVAAILDAHVAAGKPLAGTSAGLAMLGERLYGAMDGGSITSPEALADPFGKANTIERDFLHIALLKGIVTDTHFKERDRLGRLLAFVAKAQADGSSMLGLGVDESAALAVEPDGSARIYATADDGGAWLVEGSRLRGLAPHGPLTVDRVRVTGIGKGSVVHLPGGAVDQPAFIRHYGAAGGRLTQGGAVP
jgi:beta-aspartyl-peptidase (threonine type)